MCHVMYAFTTGDACGMNMITRNSYALNQGFVARASAGPAPRGRCSRETWAATRSRRRRYFERGGHGKTVLAEAP